MPAVAIEFCDPAIALVRAREALVSSPGIALLGAGEALRVGQEAVARARLAPRSVQNRFWDRLGLEALAEPGDGLDTVADLAAAHLAALWRNAQGAERVGDDAILVIPGAFDREQLGVLLGVVHSCEISAVGMVDAAVAACATLLQAPPPDSQTFHLDVLLHRTVLTELQCQGGNWQRGDVRSHRQLGLATLHDLWAKFVSELFVRSTRFDPLHRADSEQALFDRLPQALAVLAEQSRTAVELMAGDASYRVSLDREQLAQLARPHYERLIHALEGMRAPERELVVALSSRAAALPGLPDLLEARLGCRVDALGAGAAGFGALARQPEICSPDGGLRLVTGLRQQDTGSAAGAARQAVAQRAARATHVLLGDVAHPLDGPGVRVARAADDATRLVLVAPDAECASPLTLRREGGDLRVETADPAAWQCNGELLREGVRLQLGDVLRCGSGGEALRLIRVATSDGA